MANINIRGASFYKYLEQAFRYMLENPQGISRVTANPHYKYNALGFNLPFNSDAKEKGIFYYARRVLPNAYTNKFTDDIEGNKAMAKEILKKLNNEHVELASQIDPTAISQEIYDLTVNEALVQSQEEAEAEKAAGIPAGGESSNTMGNENQGAGLPSMEGLGAYEKASRGKKIARLRTETPEPQVKGLKDTPETGLDYEGKPYESDAGYAASEKASATKGPVTRTPSPVREIETPLGEMPTGIGSKGIKDTPDLGVDYNGIPIESPVAAAAPEEGLAAETSSASRTASAFQRPRMPSALRSLGANVRSKASIFLKQNTVRITSAGLGGFTGGVLTGGNPLAIGIGGGLGGTAKEWGPKFLRGSIRAGVKLSSEVSQGALNLAGPKKKAWLLLLLLIPMFILFTAFTSSPTTTITGAKPTPTPGASVTPAPGGGGGGGDIASCTFYRGSDHPTGATFQNPALPSLISDIAGQVGVPSAILAGIMRVETPSTFTDPAGSNYVTNDYDSHSSGVAYGVMQFTPGTFIDTFNNNQAEMQSLFGKNLARATIDPQSSMGPANVLRIYSIRDSIIAAAFKVRTDKQIINGDGPWDQTTVKKLASFYYYGDPSASGDYVISGVRYNYGDDLWQSYSSCQPTSPTPAPGGGTTAPGGGSSSVVYYCQADPRWQYSNSRGTACRMDIAGCGPTAAAMILSTLGPAITPNQMDQIFAQTDPPARVCGDNATAIVSFLNSDWFRSHGYIYQTVNGYGLLDINTARAYLAAGYWIISGSKAFPCPPNGWCAHADGTIDHMFVIDGINSDNTYHVRDPLNCSPSDPSERSSGQIKTNNFSLVGAWAIKKQ